MTKQAVFIEHYHVPGPVVCGLLLSPFYKLEHGGLDILYSSSRVSELGISVRAKI